MTDESRINEALAGHRDAEDRRRREVEELAEKLVVAIMTGADIPGIVGDTAPQHAFNVAEKHLAERDRRREQVKP